MHRLSWAVGPLILFLIVTGAFWKLLTKQYTWLDQPDTANQVLPWLQFQAEEWHKGEFPLWDPHVFGGQPLVGQLQPGAAYPLNWALFLLPLRNGHIQQVWLHLYFVFTHLLAALFCYLLLIDLGRSRAAAILGGAAFSLAGVVGSLGWPQMLNGAIWIPLSVLFFLRVVRGRNPLASAALSGTFLGISFLSGHHQIPTFAALMMAGLWAAEVWRKRWRAAAPAALFLLFAALLSALQTLPAYEYGARSIRWVGSQNPAFWGQYVPYTVHQQYSLYPLSVLGMVLPNVTDQDAFAGLTVLTLALAGFAMCFATREVRLFGAIAAGGLLLALGGFSVFHGAAYLLIPMVEKARTPAMALVIVQFALSVLAAYGLDALRARSIGAWWIRSLIAVGTLPWIVLAVVAGLRPEASREYERLAILGLVALALAAILHGWKAGHLSERSAVALLFVVAIFELGTVTGGNFRHREAPGGFLAELEKNADVVQFLRGRPDFVRLEVDTNALPYNVGDWDGIDQFRAYLGGMTANLAPFEMDRLAGGRIAPALFALNYYTGKEPIRAGQEEIFQGKSGLRVYRNPDALPFVWTVHEALSVARGHLIARLKASDLKRQTLLAGAAPQLQDCGGADELRLVQKETTRLGLDAKMSCKGMVIVSQTFYPGWHAFVDGREAPLYEAYGVLQGAVAEAGSHRIEFRYRPTSVYAGAWLTGIGAVLAVAVAFRSRG